MNDETEQEFDHPIDAKFCPSCGETLPTRAVEMWADELLNRYRVQIRCPSCGYNGEVVRHEGQAGNREDDADTEHSEGER
ncbi:hypothetical protein [Halarchaeum sp. P4]|uniref:hypothetical protein n=1 Tax=Halarchaeum sp. P4 TaxID=3421639 RepID=UPI003EC0A760